MHGDSEIVVRLVILLPNHISSQSVTAGLRIDPTVEWNRPDDSPSWARTFYPSKNGWILKKSPIVTGDVNDAVDPFVKMLVPCSDYLSSLCRTDGVQCDISVAIYGRGGFPEIHFSNTLIQAIGTLGADLDIDMYYLPDPPHERSGTRKGIGQDHGD